MKINRFWASKVHGYLDFNMMLNERLNFLIGVNGSGKTSAIALMGALLEGSLHKLLLTEFIEAGIEIFLDNCELNIVATKLNDSLQIKISGIDEELKIKGISEFAKQGAMERNESINSQIRLKYSDHPVMVRISKLPNPFILGLERIRQKESGDIPSYIRDRYEERVYKTASAKYMSSRKGEGAPSILEAQAIVQDYFRRIRIMENKHQDDLQKNLLLSAFSYTDYSASFPSGINSEYTIDSSVLARQNEIISTLEKLKIPFESIKDIVLPFFEKLKTLSAKQKTGGNDSILLEYLLNKGHIETAAKIIELIEKYNLKISGAYTQIDRYTKALNEFFKDTKKLISISPTGEIEVIPDGGKPIQVTALSSGEMQLVVIMAYLFFGTTQSQVIVIDEPELSLHLRWQEIFVEHLLEAKKNIQIILATHSPEIVGANDDFCVGVCA